MGRPSNLSQNSCNSRDQNDQRNTEEKSKKTLEEHYEEMGNGKYQIIVTALFGVVYVLWAIFFMTPGLFFQQPVFLCAGRECQDQKEYCSFNKNYRSIRHTNKLTITEQFELYCEKETLNSLGESLPYLGAICGLFLFMFLSDNVGRKISIGLSWFVGSLGGILLVAFENIYTILIGNFFAGFGVVPCATIGLVYLNEVTTGKFRSVSVCLMYVAFGGAEMLIWPFYEMTQTWRKFNLYILTIPYVIMNILYFYIYETPKFLQNKNQQKAIDILNTIMKINGKNIELTAGDIQKVDSTSTSDKKYSYIDLFRYKSVRKISICLLILSFGIHALYYGIQFSLDLLGRNFAKNSFFVGIADFLGYIISDIACPKFPRKRWLIITLFLTSLFCFSFVVDPVPDECQKEGQSCIQKTLQIWQAVFARFIISFSFSFMVIWMNELFPTTIRSSGLGLVLLIGVAGAQVTPFIKQLCENIGINFIFVLGFFGIIGCLVSFFVKETFNKPVLDEIPELTVNHQHDLDSENQSDFQAKKRSINSQYLKNSLLD